MNAKSITLVLHLPFGHFFNATTAENTCKEYGKRVKGALFPQNLQRTRTELNQRPWCRKKLFSAQQGRIDFRWETHRCEAKQKVDVRKNRADKIVFRIFDRLSAFGRFLNPKQRALDRKITYSWARVQVMRFKNFRKLAKIKHSTRMI
ncbi:hypothetical protein TcasGA2_TC006731 [Tribolium castaneum]|uniref:Uncharacterized protein n=1 Tax=Tribolium castaneum TaxID=7070 RepID=D6WYX7_TRICA|nr:hypothetical protein TcasGA2_TC006731 [Tribolium castaneum]